MIQGSTSWGRTTETKKGENPVNDMSMNKLSFWETGAQFYWNGFPGGSVVKNLPANAGDHLPVDVPSLSREDPPEEGMSTHSSVLAGKIPWSDGPGELQSMGVAKSQT